MWNEGDKLNKIRPIKEHKYGIYSIALRDKSVDGNSTDDIECEKTSELENEVNSKRSTRLSRTLTTNDNTICIESSVDNETVVNNNVCSGSGVRRISHKVDTMKLTDLANVNSGKLSAISTRSTCATRTGSLGRLSKLQSHDTKGQSSLTVIKPKKKQISTLSKRDINENDESNIVPHNTDEQMMDVNDTDDNSISETGENVVLSYERLPQTQGDHLNQIKANRRRHVCVTEKATSGIVSSIKKRYCTKLY